MRSRLIVPAVVLVAIVGIVLLFGRRSSGPEAATPQGGGSVPVRTDTTLPVRTVMAGTVEITIEPVRLDETGALFEVALNTHSGDLGVDLAKTSRLEVGGTAWGNAAWTGDPPGGHHRAGELSFEPGGPVAGSALLTIDGLPAPVEATWTLG